MKDKNNYDIVLIGAGIMSATLGMLLKELNPSLSIKIFERLDGIALESSDACNNAGTGHSALCELNYTPQNEDGSIDISKAVKILESFDISLQFWAYLVENGLFDTPKRFINAIPHCSLVFEDDVDFLKKRFEALKKSGLFGDLQYSENQEEIKKWMPLVFEGRDANQKLAATKSELGTDVDFGTLTREFFSHLLSFEDVSLSLHHEVKELKQEEDKLWHLEIEDLDSEETIEVSAKFVFIGAGGGSLPLLDESDIEEGKGFGGFPVSGQWLVCQNEDIIEKHHAKVYGKAAVGAPPMSVPHLDSRFIDGKKALLFGPFAGFTTKFLKEGSIFDLPASIELDNLGSMLGAFVHNLPLTKYLMEQVTLSEEDRLEVLKEYFPDAQLEDWKLERAGQRVQIIKKDEEDGGKIAFGTEVIASTDGSIAALLGASPGASTSVAIMLNLLEKCFKTEFQSLEWQNKLQKMMPTFGKNTKENPSLTLETRKKVRKILDLD